MTAEIRALLAITAAIAGAVGVAAVAQATGKPATPPASPTTCPPATGMTWTPATTINPGDHVRGTVTAAAFQTYAASITNLGTGLAGWSSLLAMPQVAGVMQSPCVLAWAPGQALPTDWPAADASAATEYHVEFTYGGTTPRLVSAFPVPLTAWVGSVAATGAATRVGIIGRASPRLGPVAASSGQPAPPAGYKPGPPTAPLQTTGPTVHLTSSGTQMVATSGVIGATITVLIDGGGSFTYVGAQESFAPTANNPGSSVPIAGYPLSAQALAALGSELVFTAVPTNGELDLLWLDAAGASHTSTIYWAPTVGPNA
jgi:hypothetical protein